MKKKKIIIVTSRFPFPLDKGDKLRIYHQIKYLSINHHIHLIAINTGPKIIREHIHEVNKYCQNLTIIRLHTFTIIYNLISAFWNREPLQVGYFYSKKIHIQIKKIIKSENPDWCYSQLIRTSKYLEDEKNNIIDYMDALSKGIERRIQKFPFLIRPLIKHEFHVTKKYETYIFNKFKKHTIITENDRNFIQHIDNEKINIIPNGVNTRFFQPLEKVNKKYDIVFVGNMSYPPNIEAAIYICKQILPILKKSYKNCNVLIGGTNPHPSIRELQSSNIYISGWVDDIRQLYASGRIFVAPMFIGTGLQNKLLEAMAMGVPCVTTKLANKALLADKSQIMIANNADEFAKSCIKILKNPQVYNNLSNEGLQFVKKRYDWKKINNNLSSLFN